MQNHALRTAVVGAGYVGIATAVGLAEQGRDILLVEQDPDRLTAVADGRIPSKSRGFPRPTRLSTPPDGSCRARSAASART